MAESRRCSAITRAGTRCKGAALDSSEYCYAHSKDRAEERKRNAAAGGRARRRSPDEIEEIKRQVEAISSALLRGGMGGTKGKPTVEKGTAAVLGQLFNTRLRAIELQRKLDRQAALEEQVVELRGRLEQMKAVRYGRSS